MKVDGWKYYNHAAIPTTAPHEQPNLAPVKDGSIWEMDGKPLLAQWVSDWDCKEKTSWWYIIKDTPFDISAINRKRRYEINKGVKNFDVKKIQPAKFFESLYDIQKAAQEHYSTSSITNKETFLRWCQQWQLLVEQDRMLILGAFSRETKELAGYCCLYKHGLYLDFAIQKAIPKYEKLNVHAALVFEMLQECKAALLEGCYICDGSRSINHETQFQNYLEKNFGFRKSFCKLNLSYTKPLGIAIYLLHPFRKLFFHIAKINRIAHLISSILKMEEIARQNRV